MTTKPIDYQGLADSLRILEARDAAEAAAATTTIPTHELIGAALDWAVALADERRPVVRSRLCFDEIDNEIFSPSTQGEQAAHIIERERIGTVPYESDEDGQPCEPSWFAFIHWERKSYGHTALTAAMRAYVAHKLGPTVEVPQGVMP